MIGEVGDSYKDVLDLDLLLAEQVDEKVVVPVKLLLDLMDRVGRRYLPDSGGRHPLWCRRLTGYYRKVLRRSSGRQARMTETQCVTRGAPLCEWKGDWSGSSLF